MAPKSTRSIPRVHFRSLRLRNFRCYKDSGPVPIRPLTVILGPNNVGKSTLLNSILLLKQTVAVDTPRETLITSGPLVDLGGFRDILHRGATKGDRSFTLDFEAEFSGDSSFQNYWMWRGDRGKTSGTVGLSISFGYSAAANQIQVREAVYSRNGKAEIQFRGHGSRIVALKEDGTELSGVGIGLLNSLPMFHSVNSGRKKRTQAEEREIRRLSDVSVTHSWGWTELHRSTAYVAPLRTAMPRYSISGATSPGSAWGPANFVQDLKSRRKVRPAGKRLKELVEAWAKKQLGILRGIDLRTIDQAGAVFAVLADEPGGFRGINVASMGEGVSQVLPILGSVLGSRRGSCVLVEQPELHLHPDLQARLADLFIEEVATNGKQVILETHSEHLLLRIRRRVAEGRLGSDMVSILYVDRPGRESRVRQLPLTDDGHVAEWPDGFFEEGIEEAYRIASARKVGG